MTTTPEPTPRAGRPAAPARMQQLTVFLCEQDHWQHRPLYLAILELVRTQGGAGATVLKGAAGYSAGSRTIHTSHLVDVVPVLPVVVLVVDTPARIGALLPPLQEMIGAHGGLITVADVAVYPPAPAAPAPGRLRVRDIMAAPVVTVPPDTPVAELLALLLNRPYKALPVVDADQHVLGMVTDVDLLEKAALGVRLSVVEAIRARGEPGFAELVRALRTSGKTARDVMGTRPGAVIGPDAPFGAAARTMLAQGVKRLPVIDHDGRLVGLVGRLDILKAASHVTNAPDPGPAGAVAPGAQTLADVLIREVPTVDAATPLAVVVDLLVGRGGLRRVLVLDSPESRHVAGIITDADLVQRVAAPARSGLLPLLRERLSLLGLIGDEPLAAAGWDQQLAGTVMTTPVVTAPESLPIAAAVQIMIARGVKVLPVTDAAGRLVGTVNRAGLLRALLRPGDSAPAPDA